ncbi:MAG TPA: hypothetical protein PLP14_05240, partial [Chitinophagaceae bacterium]|nr:hypothetical protein [Chitinophagaceae bacterium]
MRIEIVLNWKMKFSMILYVVLFPTCLKAQLSAADSAYFQNVFTRPLYIDTTVNPGNWYQYSPVSSFYNHYLILDTNFTFKPHDLDSVHLLTIDDSLHDESIINTSFQANPSLLSQSDPVVSIPFHLNGKRGKAYSFLYPDTIPEPCRYAFIIVPGTGTNASYDIIRGLGYHNLLCQMVSTCRSYGDVFTFIKPNEECRAIYWNNLKLNEYIVDYLITQHTFYGITYLAEMMATIQYLKMKYDKVFLFGLSEGGYSALLASLYTEPDAALISGGYSIQFDTCTAESSILYTRFDSLVYQWNKDSLRNRIAQSKTHYLFTWGDGDPVLTMDP